MLLAAVLSLLPGRPGTTRPPDDSTIRAVASGLWLSFCLAVVQATAYSGGYILWWDYFFMITIQSRDWFVTAFYLPAATTILASIALFVGILYVLFFSHRFENPFKSRRFHILAHVTLSLFSAANLAFCAISENRLYGEFLIREYMPQDEFIRGLSIGKRFGPDSSAGVIFALQLRLALFWSVVSPMLVNYCLSNLQFYLERERPESGQPVEMGLIGDKYQGKEV